MCGHASSPHRGDAGLVVDGERIMHLERSAGDSVQRDVDVDQLIEAQSLPVAQRHFEHRHVTFGPQLVIRMPDVSKVGNAGLFEEREVPAVMHDPHRVGLGKTHPYPMRKVVVGRVGRRVGRDAHRTDLTLSTSGASGTGIPHRGASPCPTCVVASARAARLERMTPAINELVAAGVAFSSHEYERGDSLHDFGVEAADKLGLDRNQVFKTLLVAYEHGGHPQHAVGIVPVSGKLNLKAIAIALGAKKAEMCDPALAERLTGYVVGGISPLGQRKRLPTVIDEIALVFDIIYVSGGKRGLDIGVGPQDLTDLLDAVVADISV